MAKRKRRTPDEIIAAKEAEIARLKVRAAQQAASNDPAYAPLRNLLTDYNKVEANAHKNLGSGPQGADVRIATHTAWVDEINALCSLSQAQLDAVKDLRQMVRSVIAHWIEAGVTPDPDVIQKERRELVTAFNTATEEEEAEYQSRQNHRKGIKASTTSKEETA